MDRLFLIQNFYRASKEIENGKPSTVDACCCFSKARKTDIGGPMTIRGTSAKKFAKDVANGFLTITAANLRKYTPQELGFLLTNLRIVSRETRAVITEEGDYDGVKKKNWRLQNISRTTLIINTFIKSRRIKM